jgi:hypothetical protein
MQNLAFGLLALPQTPLVGRKLEVVINTETVEQLEGFPRLDSGVHRPPQL